MGYRVTGLQGYRVTELGLELGGYNRYNRVGVLKVAYWSCGSLLLTLTSS